MNYHKALPGFTINAHLVLKDCISRVMKTYKPDTRSVANNEYYISDLFSGVPLRIVAENGTIVYLKFIIRD